MKNKVESREERVRRMVADPTTWPGDMLCMKRIQSDKLTEFGRIVAYDGPSVTVFDSDRVGLRMTYASLDHLIEAGWRVD